MDGQWDKTHPWQRPDYYNVNDRRAAERFLRSDDASERKMAASLVSANPVTPSAEIRAFGETPRVGDRFAPHTPEITINECVNRGAIDALYPPAPTDFSGRTGSYQASSTPSFSVW